MPRRTHNVGSRASVALFLAAFSLLGYLSSHAVAYEIAGVAVEDHHHVHGYFSWLELAAGVLATAGLAGSIAVAFRGATLARFLHPGDRAVTIRRAVGWGAVLPAVVFVGAEFAERIVAGAPMQPDTELLVIGTAIQLVVGLLAWTLARHCIRAVDAVVAWLRAAPRMQVRRSSSSRPRMVDGPPVRGVMARSQAGRAPPRCRATR
jgi:hypothetical protein